MSAPAFTSEAAVKLYAWAMADRRYRVEAVAIQRDERLTDIKFAPEVMGRACDWARSVIRHQRREGGEELWPSAMDALGLAQILLTKAPGGE